MSDAALERTWNDYLLPDIQEGRVVPIIGRDLLTVQVNGRSARFYDLLAEQLASDLGIEGPVGNDPLNQIACRYQEGGGDIDDVYVKLSRIVPDIVDAVETGELPKPLLQLAEITDFNLFVSTTFDPLLKAAIDKVRFDGDDVTRSLTYYPKAVGADLSSPMPDRDHPVVYHLLGSISRVPGEYAMTEADTLEFMHNLQLERMRPNRLFDELNRQQLLIVGCSIPDWLTRFLLRIAKGKPVTDPAKGKIEVVAGSSLDESSSLRDFLRHFSKGTKVMPGDAVEFVAELHRRWKAVPRKDRPTKPEGRRSGAEGMADTVKDAIFLSYASEDRAAVESIKSSLTREGYPVWFDDKQLMIGDEFTSKIKRNIKECSLFMPVVSRHTLTADDRFFRIEWLAAQERAPMRRQDLPFILPVVIDDTNPTSSEARSALPEGFLALDWAPLPAGRVTEEFLSQVKTQYRSLIKDQST